MDILKLIKNRKSIRKYKNKKIPNRVLKRIIEAIIWSPSVHGIQPWKLFIVRSRDKIIKIVKILRFKAEKFGGTLGTSLYSSADIIDNSQIVIIVYNLKKLTELVSNTRFFRKIDRYYVKIAHITEIESVAAAIQNMILTAEELKIGSCWLTTPLFCEHEINKILNAGDSELIAIITLGYADEEGHRSRRRIISHMIKYI